MHAELPAILRRDVETLACNIGERNVFRPPALAAAAEFVATSLRASGLTVTRRPFSCHGQTVCNLAAEIPGTRPGPALVVGAHYDSRCAMTSQRGRTRVPGAPGTPGANDNASGVAVLLALARHFAAHPPPSPLRLLAFVNEEPPFFQTPLMGSWVYARDCRARAEALRGAVILDTLGCYSAAPGSQRYPFPLALWPWPRTGNFVALLSNRRSRPWLRQVAAAFRRHTSFSMLTAALPTPIRRIGWSDDWAFWRHGYPAVCLTDTAYLRSPHYHQPTDLPAQLDFPKLAALTTALTQALPDLAS